jgi:hypothetical protein
MRMAWRAEDLEILEAISQDADTRDLFLRMAHLWRDGRLAPFLHELVQDNDLDAETTAASTELATDERFLRAVEEYVVNTKRLH